MTDIYAEDYAALLLSQDGDDYVFGVEVKPSETDPRAFDCSELIEWGGARLGVKPRVPDGSWNQAKHCRDHDLLVSVMEALVTRGALLFRFSSNPFLGTRPKSAHVAMSLGDGRTIEARGKAYGVGTFVALGRGWTHAGLIPGVKYEPKPDYREEYMLTTPQMVSRMDH